MGVGGVDSVIGRRRAELQGGAFLYWSSTGRITDGLHKFSFSIRNFTQKNA